MNTFARRHRISLAAGLSAAIVFGGTIAASAQTLTNALPQNPRAAAIALPQNTLNQIAALEAEAGVRTPTQNKLDSQLWYAAKMRAGNAVAAGVPSLKLDVTPSADGSVEVDITAHVTDALLAQIGAVGGQIGSSFPKYDAIRATLPLSKLETVAGLPGIQFIKPALYPYLQGTNPAAAGRARVMRMLGQYFRPIGSDRKAGSLQAHLPGLYNALSSSSINLGLTPGEGSLDSEGDTTHRAALARSTFNADGTGVKIGVISDSDDFLESSQASGNLGQVTVLSGQSGRPGTGEGTAMMEIVHDIAPGASIYFSSSGNSEAQFATNIEALASQGCQIIVDDIGFFDESPFQDGIVSQAVQTVTARGVLYFSAAGNSGNFTNKTSSVWQGDFIDSGASITGSTGGKIAAFLVSGSNVYNANGIADFTGAGQHPYLFWNDPLGHSNNDYNLFVVNSSLTTVVTASTNVQNGSQDPIENLHNIPGDDYLVIVLHSGSPRFLHLDLAGQGGQLGIYTNARTRGHSAVNAVGAYGVAATPVAGAHPNYGAPTGPYPNPFNTGNQIEHFSSDGPMHLYYNTNGSAITPNDLTSTGGFILHKPDITAADGVTTSLNGVVTGGESFAPFFGTSAAAPHAAAITALLLSYSPGLTQAQVRNLLTNTAIDIMDAGDDRDSGYGILDAFALLSAAPSQRPTIMSFTPSSGQAGASVTITGTNFTGTTSVKFNGADASFNVASATSITATVPAGATTGSITVTTPKGTATSATPFTVSASAPTITSFSPTIGQTGTSVQIVGTNLGGATGAAFNGTKATTFSVVNSTTVNATVPASATTGPITISTPTGTATSAAYFTVTIPAPTIISFTPVSGPIGTSVKISGTSLAEATSVAFNGAEATTFTVSNATSITTIVPATATTGTITITTPSGTAASTAIFTVTILKPTVTTFQPTNGPVGTSVIVAGTKFTGASAVTFNNQPAMDFTVNSDQFITATVPAGATTGKIAVVTPIGTATSSANFTVTTSAPPVSSITLNPTSVLGGDPSAGTVTLSTPAPAGGLTISIASSDPAATPTSTTIEEGATTGTFTVSTVPVSTVTSVRITARGSTAAAALKINPPSATSIVLDPTIVIGGQPSNGTLTVNGPAPTGGISIPLVSSKAAASVTSCYVPGGQTSGTFTVNTIPVSSITIANISAKGSTISATLTVNTPVPASITLDPLAVIGGEKSTGTLTLQSPAPTGGWSVQMSSDDAAAIPVACSVAGGAITGTFSVGTKPVAAITTATISAKGTGIGATLTINPPVATGITFSPTAVTGGSPSTGTLTLGSAAPSTGITFQLNSSDPAAAVSVCTVPGGKTVGTFVANTVPVATVTASKITVAGTSTGGTLTVNPPVVTSIKLTLTTVQGGKPTSGTVTLNGAAPVGGLTIAMTCSDPSTKATPAIVPEGLKIGTFTVNTIPVAKVTSVTIKASGSIAQATLTVNPPAAANILLNPTAVIGGSPSTGTLTLSGPAPIGGITIPLKSNSVAATVTSCTVLGGATSGAFTVKTVPVKTATLAAISATGTTVTTTLTINPPLFKSITLNPPAVIGGTQSTGTLTLSSPAPVGGWTVQINSNNAVVANSSCTIAGGALTGTFPLATKPVEVTTAVFLKANTGTVGAYLTVNPPKVTSIQLNPTSVIGGSPSAGKLTIGSLAPASGLRVTLTSNKTAAVVATCIVPAGTKAGTFTVGTLPVATLTSALITVKGTTIGATLVIKPPVATTIKIDPVSLIGGATARGTLTLGSRAPTGGFTLTIVSTSPAAKPAACLVAAGATSGTFTITTTPVAISTAAAITVKGTTVGAKLTIAPPTVMGLKLNPVKVAGGTISTGTLTLTGAAPTGGKTIALASNNAAAQVTSCTVAAGATSGTFTVNTTPVKILTEATISAKGTSIGAALTVTPPTLKSITLNPSVLIGGDKSTGTLTITSPAPAGGWQVQINSNNAAATPAAGTIASGATTGTFTIATKPVAAVTVAVISSPGTTTSVSLIIDPPKVTAITLNPASVTGGSKTAGKLTIGSAAPAAGYTITLVSNSGAASPAACNIPGGAKTGTFSISTLPVAVSTKANITAKGTTVGAILTIMPPVVTKITISPTSVIGGVSLKGTLTLGSAAPAGGFTVTFVSSNTSAKPATCVVSTGATSGTFTITTTPVATPTAATITASGTAVGATLNITP